MRALLLRGLIERRVVVTITDMRALLSRGLIERRVVVTNTSLFVHGCKLRNRILLCLFPMVTAVVVRRKVLSSPLVEIRINENGLGES